LGLHNICLLKLLHRLFCSQESAWACWVRQRASLASLEGELIGDHWSILRSLPPLYQAITVVELGDGLDTSFWYDAWCDDDALADRFPAIHSHCTKKQLSVAQVLDSGLTNSRLFVPQLSAQASAELSQLQTIVSQVVLSSARDNRRGPFCLPQSKLDSGSLYRLLRVLIPLPNSSGKPVHPHGCSSSFG